MNNKIISEEHNQPTHKKRMYADDKSDGLTDTDSINEEL